MKKIIYFSAILFLAAFSFFSCDNIVGLGAKLNLEPPVVTITSPAFMQMLSEELEIKGTASDMQEIVNLEIMVERVSKTGNPWKHEWHAERGTWRSMSGGSDVWESCEGGWDINTQANSVEVEWSVKISMLDADDGEFLITVGAENNVKNRGAQAECRFIIDKDGPVTTVLSPPLDVNATGFIHYSLENPSLLNTLLNQSISVQYEVKDEFSIDTIQFILYDGGGHIYYEGEVIKGAGWSGRVTIFDKEDPEWKEGLPFINTNAGGVFPGSPHYLQLVSHAYDKAENEEIANHGWFCYWPESDRPWVTGVGYETAVIANRAENQIYPGSDIQLLSYDDDGVHSVSYDIYKSVNGVLVEKIGEKVIKINEPFSEDSPPSAFFSFPITAPEEAAIYYITIDCEDINGTKGLNRVRYFSVMDISKPDVQITSPDSNLTLFGDSAGTFNITGNASDGIDPKSLYVVWIKPGNSTDRFEYQSAESEVWDIVDTPRTGVIDGADYWDAPEGNKVFKLNLGMQTIGSDGRRYRDFSFSLNLFTHLGIGSSVTDVKLVTQSFVFRVEGNSGNAVTKFHSVRGDINPPVLTIQDIVIKRSGHVDQTIPASSFDSPTFKLPNLEVNDRIEVNGTWSDDSFTAWNNVSLMGDFEVTWNGVTKINNGDSTIVTLNTNGTWKVDSFVLDANEVLKGGGLIEARLRDLGGNMATARLSARADTDTPVFMFISSEMADGAYNTGRTIEIYLEFNKDVIKVPAANPTLTLNTGVNATYKGQANGGTDGHHRHVFTYTVAAGNTNVDVLTVNSMNTTDADWEDLNAIPNNPKMQIPTGRNLGNTKAIRIDTAAPTITRIHALNDTGHYNAGKTIYIVVTFNEEIGFTQGNGNLTTLNLNGSTAGVAGSPMLMGNSSLLFTYLVAAGNNASTLDATSFVLGTGAGIADIAGNALTSNAIPSSANISTNTVEPKTITIDTDRPAAPAITGTIASGGSSPDSESFTIAGEVNAIIEYQINGGPWLSYKNVEVDISTTGTYNIITRQTDLAGNESPWSTPYSMEILRTEKFLQSLDGSTPGTYSSGTINIDFKLSGSRIPIVVSGTPRLRLNVTKTGGAIAYANSTGIVSGTTILRFAYTIEAGDSVDVLGITALELSGANITAAGTNVNNSLTSDFAEEQALSFYTNIRIRTDIPELLGNPVLTNDSLTLTFSEDIDKGEGLIILEQPASTYRAPAVLSKTEYNRYLGRNSAIATYYTKGTNGADELGNPDLTEKYVLNFNYDPTEQALINILTSNTVKANRVEIDVRSGAVTRTGAVLTVNLTPAWGFQLGVKGVDYDITLDRRIVQDEQNNTLAVDVTRIGIRNPGVNPPVIRVNKEKERIENSATNIPNLSLTYYYNWAPPPPANAPVSISTPANQVGWANLGSFSIGPTFTAYVQANAPGPNYFNLKNFVHGEATGTGQFQTNVGVWHNAGTNQLHAGWNNPGGNGWTQIATGDSTAGANGALQQIQNYSQNIWVSINDNNANLETGMNFGRGGIVIYHLWAQAQLGDVVESTSRDTPPVAGYINVGISRIEVTQTNQSPTTLVAIQPLTASVKITSQTPGVVIRYSRNVTETSAFSGPFKMGDHTKPSVTMPTSSTTVYNGTFNIGENDLKGNLYAIRAQIYNGNTAVTDAVAYETASRSVIMFSNIPEANNWNGLNTAAGTGNQVQLWIRGGDDLNGESATPGFPLSWAETDYSGIRLFTRPSSAGGIWYWVSWNVNTAAFFNFLAGRTPNNAGAGTGVGSLEDIRNNGPTRWAWAKNAWSLQHREFPLYPGGALLFTRDTRVSNPATENFEFYNAFSRRRD